MSRAREDNEEEILVGGAGESKATDGVLTDISVSSTPRSVQSQLLLNRSEEQNQGVLSNIRLPWKKSRYTDSERSQMRILHEYCNRHGFETSGSYLAMNERFSQPVNYNNDLGVLQLTSEVDPLLSSHIESSAGEISNYLRKRNQSWGRSGYSNDPINMLCSFIHHELVKLAVVNRHEVVTLDNSLAKLLSLREMFLDIRLNKPFSSEGQDKDSIYMLFENLDRYLGNMEKTINNTRSFLSSKDHFGTISDYSKESLQILVQYLYHTYNNSSDRNFTLLRHYEGIGEDASMESKLGCMIDILVHESSMSEIYHFSREKFHNISDSDHPLSLIPSSGSIVKKPNPFIDRRGLVKDNIIDYLKSDSGLQSSIYEEFKSDDVLLGNLVYLLGLSHEMSLLTKEVDTAKSLSGSIGDVGMYVYLRDYTQSLLEDLVNMQKKILHVTNTIDSRFSDLYDISLRSNRSEPSWVSNRLLSKQYGGRLSNSLGRMVYGTSQMLQHLYSVSPEQEMRKAHEKAVDFVNNRRINQGRLSILFGSNEIYSSLTSSYSHDRSSGILLDRTLLLESQLSSRREENNSLMAENRRLMLILDQQSRSSDNTLNNVFHRALIGDGDGINNDTQTLSFLLSEGADRDSYCLDYEEYYGYTALHIAILKGDRSLIKWLIDNEVDIDHTDMRGDTALDVASRSGNREIVSLLKEYGAVSTRVDNCTQKIHDIIGSDELTGDSESFTQEMRDSLDILLTEGGDINGSNNLPNAWKRDLPLHTALVKGNQSLISYLMDKGADPLAREPRKNHTSYERLEYALQHCWPGEQQEALERTKSFIKDNYPVEFGISSEAKISEVSSISVLPESKSDSSVSRSEEDSSKTSDKWQNKVKADAKKSKAKSDNCKLH